MFEVASHRGLTDDYVMNQPGGWLLTQYEHMMRTRWNAMMEQVIATELGVNRGIVLALANKQTALPALPSFEDSFAARRSYMAARPAWVDRFEKVNRIGRFATEERTESE